MLSRKNQSTPGAFLPEDWKKEIMQLLNSTYKKELEISKRYFDVYGIVYPDEILIAVSLLNANNTTVPVTYFISSDLNTDTPPKQNLNDLLDCIGIFFDSFFQTKEWDEYQANWEEIKYKRNIFYYKISRENVSLTLMATKILEEKN